MTGTRELGGIAYPAVSEYAGYADHQAAMNAFALWAQNKEAPYLLTWNRWQAFSQDVSRSYPSAPKGDAPNPETNLTSDICVKG